MSHTGLVEAVHGGFELEPVARPSSAFHPAYIVTRLTEALKARPEHAYRTLGTRWLDQASANTCDENGSETERSGTRASLKVVKGVHGRMPGISDGV